MGHKTSVYMPDELFDRWKRSGRSLPDLIAAGLEAVYGNLPEGALPEPSPHLMVTDDRLATAIDAALHRMDTLTELLTKQGYVIVLADELRAMIGSAVAGAMELFKGE